MGQIVGSIIQAIIGWASVLLVPILSTVVSVIYFKYSPQTEPLYRRILASAHGLVITILYLAAMAISLAHLDNQNLSKPFLYLLLVPLIFIVISFFFYKGRWGIHALQLVNLLCLVWTSFFGGMAITGVWL